MTIKAKKSKINLREKLAELLNFRQIRDRLDGLGLYLGKDRTGTAENLAVRGGANVDDLQLAEISAALGGTAVDVFVYDTRNDSDGGKWRERTSHTSWYNEELNTATRGGRREFPAVAVIVAESNKVTIYDGDDPDLSMWMVFDDGGNSAYLMTRSATCISAINGSICAGCDDNNNYGHILYVNFISDIMQRWSKQDGYTESYRSGTGISTRNGTFENILDTTTPNLVNKHINDVAMTVLPNAPIDSETGLPVPTIAVATDGGVSVIKDDGSVVDIVYTNQTIESLWLKQNRIWIAPGNGGLIVGDIPDTDKSSGTASGLSSSINGWNAFANTNETLSTLGSTDTLTHGEVFGSDQGLNLIYEEKSDPASSLVAYTTSSYNTGWMPGDIKLAALSDTKIEKVGVDESTELIANNDFSSPINESDGVGWDLVSGTQSIDVGVLTIQPTTYGGVEQIINVLPNKKYIFNVVVHATTTGTARIYLGDSSSQGAYYNEPSLTAGAYNFEFTTSSDTVLKIKLATTSESGSNVSFSSTSLKQTGELITNGTFDNGTTGWIDQSSGTQSVDSSNVSAGELTLTRLNSDVEQVSQLLNLVEGKRYVLSFDITATTNNKGQVWIGIDLPLENQTLGDGTQTANSILNTGNILGVGSYLYTFTAGSTNYLSIRVGANDTISWDNISVRLAEEDRSVNDKGLQIFGEIDKTPVAPGADLVAYSGFSANNYLMQPYNSDLDFGTGDFSIMGWFKTSSQSSDQYILDRSTDGSPRFLIAIRASTGSDPNRLQLAAYDASGVAASLIATDFTVTNNVWTNFCAVFDGSKYRLFVNGVQSSIITESSGVDISNDGSPLIIGARYDSSASMSGELALLRISATAPTDAQIAKIYRDEKVLFQDGAQATLYGISDAVTALAYDDKTELLHVGTSSGRSDFAGLRRINNTTIPVTTSISASNNLIAEQ